MQTIKKYLTSEVGLYIIIGGCTTLVNLITFYILETLLHIDTTISNIIAISISILFAYITNKIIVFKSHTDSFTELLKEMISFISARLSTMILEVGGVYLLVNIIHQPSMIGKLETQIIVIIGNYFISKFFVFKKTSD